MIAYIKTQGSRIVKEGRHLLVKQGTAVFNTLFTYKLKQLLVFGNIEISHRALAQLMRNNIDVVFLTQNGRYLGRLAPVESKNVYLRKKQYNMIDDSQFGLRMSKNIVAGKLSNMATLLMRIKRTRNQKDAGNKAKSIMDLMQRLNESGNVDTVRGYEGRGSAIYFEGLRYGFIGDIGFTRRVRRPPTDPVNSVLSLLYTFLMNRVYAAVRIAALDPYPGFLHSLDYGRYSLVLDLMEEFRSIIADTLTLSLFNLNILQKNDFFIEKQNENVLENPEEKTIADVSADPIGLINMHEDPSDCFDIPEQRIEKEAANPFQITGKYPVKLHPDAFKRIIEAFEKKLGTEFFHPSAQRQLSYSDAIIFQAGQYRKVIEGEAGEYQPILLK
ncbi:MAG: CRISPR-associated endonuclease Cas1 [Proteobacteria bacterium]|nr:CRISPR-associated endonuclease Cas1 [Pseudomonadota bacterium]